MPPITADPFASYFPLQFDAGKFVKSPARVAFPLRLDVQPWCVPRDVMPPFACGSLGDVRDHGSSFPDTKALYDASCALRNHDTDTRTKKRPRESASSDALDAMPAGVGKQLKWTSDVHVSGAAVRSASARLPFMSGRTLALQQQSVRRGSSPVPNRRQMTLHHTQRRLSIAGHCPRHHFPKG